MKLNGFALTLALGSVVSTTAFAQGYDELGGYNRTEHDSEQYAAIEARFGPYVPNVDEDVNGAPFEQTFGDKAHYAFGLQVDWQMLRIPWVGTLGPGVGWSYVRYSRDAPFSDGTGVSDQKTRLWVMPMWGVGVLRVDVFAKKWGIPFVPYGKLGLVYALWGCSSGDSRCYADNGKVGRGSEIGSMYAAGLMLLLDWMDEDSAKEMDNSVGVNNSYIFGEWYASDVDSFGDGMEVGTDTWTLGLAFEF